MSENRNKFFGKWAVIIVAVIAFVVGLVISNSANNTAKNKGLKEENDDIATMGFWLEIPSAVILLLMIVGIAAVAYSKPLLIEKLLKMKYIFGFIAILLVMLFLCGTFIRNYKDNTELDDETRNDKYAILGQWITNLSTVFIVLSYFVI
jgi:protein-S-isoprenylcysteine O-methyltransferase Ste14